MIDADRVRRWLGDPVDVASLVAFRVLFGALMAFNVLRYEWEGWVHEQWIAPTVTFPYPGFAWVQPLHAWGLPSWSMHLVFGVVFVSAIGIALGRAYRLSVASFFIAFTYLELIDRTNYLNHYYLVSLLAILLFFMPLDARSVRRGWAPRWVLSTLRAQLALVYVFAGLAKLRADWLLDAQPLTTWLARHIDMPLVGSVMDDLWLAYAMSWAGFLFDLTIPFWLLWKKSRPYAYLAVVGFHLVTGALFPIGVFPMLMIVATTLFFDPTWPRHFGDGTSVAHPSAGDGPPAKGASLALALWFAVQLLVPMRQHLYPGNSCWTEDGYRFAWNVMVMEKTGQVDFLVRDSVGDTVVHAREELTPLQLRMMATQPDMILSYAHHLHDRWLRDHHEDVEVRADAWASLNGRPRQRLIDPDVDLASVRPSLQPRWWVVPLRE